MRKILGLCAAVALLSGCAMLNGYTAAGINTANADLSATVKNIQSAHGLEATVIMEAMCSVSIGELARNDTHNPEFPVSVIRVCGAPAGTTFFATQPTTTAVTTTISTETKTAPPPKAP